MSKITKPKKRLILVTLQSDPFRQREAEPRWMIDNRCARMGSASFLFYDDISLEEAADKFVGLIPQTERASAFLVSFPFIHQATKVLENDLARIFGEKPSTVGGQGR
jgi:hypothetical protein